MTIYNDNDFSMLNLNDMYDKIAYEAFFSKRKEVTEIITNTPKVSATKLLQLVKPGDLIVSYPKWNDLKFLNKISYYLNSFAQGSSFSSIKIIGKKKEYVIGYGVYNNSTNFDKVPIMEYIESYSGIVLLRYNEYIANSTKNKMFEVIEQLYQKQIPYSLKQIITSVLAHVFKIYNRVVEDINVLNYLKSGLICSTIIYKIFQMFGVKIKSLYGGDTIWPVDFLISDSFNKICCYFDKGEYI